MLENIKQYLLQYKLFKEIEDDIGFDYQTDQPDSFSLHSVPETRLLNEDVLGNKYMQFSFTLTSRAYTATDLNRIENLKLLDDFSEWVYLQNQKGNLPILNKNQIATELVVTSNAYLYSNDPTIQNGVYQVQLKLYYKEVIENGN